MISVVGSENILRYYVTYLVVETGAAKSALHYAEGVVKYLDCRCCARRNNDGTIFHSALIQECIAGVSAIEVTRNHGLEPYGRIAVGYAVFVVFPLVEVGFAAGFTIIHLCIAVVAKFHSASHEHAVGGELNVRNCQFGAFRTFCAEGLEHGVGVGIDYIHIRCLFGIDGEHIEVVAAKYGSTHGLIFQFGYLSIAIRSQELIFAANAYCRIVDFVGIVGINYARGLIRFRFEIYFAVRGLIGLYGYRSLVFVE